MRRLILSSLLIILFGSTIAIVGTASADSHCTIPESGPWPPCATDGSNNTGENGECVIPESGPWPPCATDGSNNTGDDGECVIPESGPWPSCATDGSNNTGGNSECVIPESGPWPPCTTDGNHNTGGNGPSSGNSDTAPPQHTPSPTPVPPPSSGPSLLRLYDLAQTRTLFLAILNTEIATAAIAPDSLLIPAIWEADSGISLEENVLHLTSTTADGVRHELVATVGAQGGQPAFVIQYLDVNSQRVSDAVQAAYQAQILAAFTTRLQNELKYSSVTGISAENGVLTISYTIAPTVSTLTYSAAQTRDLFLIILNEDGERRFGNWQPDTVITLENRKITLRSEFWDGTQLQTLELVARLGAANGDPLVGLEQLKFNGQDAAPWDRTSAEEILQNNLGRRIRARVGDVTISSMVAANGTLTINYR